MTIINAKGGFNKRLIVTQNSFSESVTVLKNAFLKKTENYSLGVSKFLINKSPSIFLDEGVILEIKQFEDTLGDFPPNTWPAHILPKHRQFTPKNCYSVQEFVRQLQVFFHQFGNVVLSRGYNTGGANLPGFPAPWLVYPETGIALNINDFKKTDFVRKQWGLFLQKCKRYKS